MIYKDKGCGDPAGSLNFWIGRKHHLGEVVEVICSSEERYSLQVKDADGNEIWLSGCSTSSYSCWVTEVVLRDSGFSKKEATNALELDWFTLTR